MLPRLSPHARSQSNSRSPASRRATTGLNNARTARSTRNASQNGPDKCPKFSADPSVDIEGLDPGAVAPPKLQNYDIGVDFGTTFSSIAYYPHLTAEDKAGVRASDIRRIKNWPEDNVNNGSSEQVPTAIWYPQEPIRRDPIQGVQFDHDAKEDIIGSQLRSIEFDHKAALAHLSPWGKDGNGEVDENDHRLEEFDNFYFGYQALWNRYNVRCDRDVDLLVLGAKSELFKTPHSKIDSRKLQTQLRYLIDQGIIRKYGKRDAPDVRDVRDVITDLFVKLLLHTKRQLIIIEGFTNECPVQWHLAVPTIWDPMSSDVLKVAMEDAIRITGFGKQGSPISLSTGTEPEFAATWVLEKCQVPLDGRITTILDNGGGTCDAATFRISKRDVLRLGKLVCVANGCACGGIYANKNFWDLLVDRLASEDYLGMNGDSLASIADRFLPDFESTHKRRFDMVKDPPTPAHGIHINGLRGDKRMGRTNDEVKRFEDNYLTMDSSDYKVILEPLLSSMWKVLRGQLDAVKAKRNGELVQNVVLVGGFSAAPSVRSFIKLNLVCYAQDVTRELQLKTPYKIHMIEDTDRCVTAVASGGVLVGLNRETGPRRIAQLSYGLLSVERYRPNQFPGHKYAAVQAIAKPREGPNGEKYIHVINYFLEKGERVDLVHQYKLGYPIMHTICLQELETCENFYCEEVIYVSNRAPVSSYPLTHEKNMHAHEVHRILVDIAFFREEVKRKRLGGQRYCAVKFDLLLWVDGKTLNYQVRYPPVPAGQDPFKGSGEVKNEGQICITAAFLPGAA